MNQDKKTEALSTNVIRGCDGYWELFNRPGIPTPPYEITGKYLFFSPNKEILIDIAIEELKNIGFHHAKTNMI